MPRSFAILACLWRPIFALEGLSLRLTDRFLLGDAALLAGGNEPTLAPNRAQHFTASDFLAKAFQQGLLRLPRSQHDFRQNHTTFLSWNKSALHKTLPELAGSGFGKDRTGQDYNTPIGVYRQGCPG